jgi:hypothetical protein
MAGNGRLVRSRLAIELDRSEKVGLSYALGQAMTGIFCRRVLSVPHLMHVDRYGQRFGVTFGAGRKRPDLIGHKHTGWIVAEAKGRSNGMETELRAKLEEQKRSISTISGQPPELTVGCVASFPPGISSMLLNAFDPVDDEPESIQIRIELDRFLLAYYEPFVTAVDSGEPSDGIDGYLVTEIGPFGLTVGVLEVIYDAVKQRAARPAGLRGVVDGALDGLRNSALSDGTFVSVDWTEALATSDRDEGVG